LLHYWLRRRRFLRKAKTTSRSAALLNTTLTRAASTINFVGVGGRAGFYVNPWASIEAELSYDFELMAGSPILTTDN
jgi:hypothetical protein